ncbi:KLH42 protein, partial [Polypterus senegalus]
MSTDEIVAIIMEDKTYNVSKSKLIENSDYFRALFSSGMRESKENRVQLQGLSAHGLELVLRFINTSQVHVDNDNLEDLIQAATFLQVTAIYKLLLSEICQDNCLELYYLADLYGLVDLRTACLTFMACYYHVMLRREEFRCLPAAFGQQVKDLRMKGRATLMAFGDFSGISQDSLLSMLRYEEVAQRWLPFDCNFPADMVNVRGYGSAVLDNYFFIVGGYRITSQEISAAHCYNPSQNEWIQIASLNQKRAPTFIVDREGLAANNVSQGKGFEIEPELSGKLGDELSSEVPVQLFRPVTLTNSHHRPATQYRQTKNEIAVGGECDAASHTVAVGSEGDSASNIQVVVQEEAETGIQMEFAHQQQTDNNLDFAFRQAHVTNDSYYLEGEVPIF